MKEQTRMQLRNTLHLDPPSPDTEENRISVENANKRFGKVVVWNTFKEVEDIVSGQMIMSLEPVDNFIQTKVDAVTATLGVNSDRTGAQVEPEPEPEPEPEVKSASIPEDMVCPHCGSKARTETSYLKNHGDNCLHKT
jgi:hypothetical protein